MKRILIIGLSDNIGGIETFFHAYYRKMDLKKYSFDFVTVCNNGVAFCDEYKKNGSKVYILPSFIRHPLKYYRKLCNVMEKGRYDIVHINMLSAANILPLEAARRAKVKNIILHSHSSDIPGGLLRRVLHLLNLKAVRSSRTVKLACGDVAGKWLFGPHSSFTIIPNAVETREFTFNDVNRKKIREKYNIGEREYLMGCVGRLSDKKNQVFLIDVLAALREKDDFKLMLIGDGEKKKQIIRRAKQLGVSDRLIVVGSTRDINMYYSSFDIFTFPSIFEGMPISPIEAQINGLKCIMSPDITKEVNLGGVLYTVLDKDLWAKRIIAERRKNNATNRKKYLSDTFDIDKQFGRLVSIYDNGGGTNAE